MKSICFFNNKGGVGKTTLLCNVAAFLAQRKKLRVLVVDADPQCNSTQLILGDARVYEMYAGRATSSRRSPQRQNSGSQTLFDILRPIAVGESSIAEHISPLRSDENRFSVDIIAGHPGLATLEDTLSNEWLQFKAGKIGGARRTNWTTQLCKAVDEQYDFAFFDVGPSLGALNRSLLVGVDYFVTPMGCDIFSIMGINNIADWFGVWIKEYDESLEDVKDSDYRDDLSGYSIRQDTTQMARFIGYTVQQYITKNVKGGKRRPTAAFEKILNDIPSTIERELRPFLPDEMEVADLRLGDVPNMFSLVPLAQKANAPIHGIEAADGLVGAQFSQQENYVTFINNLAEAVERNAGVKSENGN